MRDYSNTKHIHAPVFLSDISLQFHQSLGRTIPFIYKMEFEPREMCFPAGAAAPLHTVACDDYKEDNEKTQDTVSQWIRSSK